MKMIRSIKIDLATQSITLTIDEAQTLRNELNTLFGTTGTTPPVQMPMLYKYGNENGSTSLHPNIWMSTTTNPAGPVPLGGSITATDETWNPAG